MFEIEVENTVTYTSTISDEDEIKVKKYISEHKDELRFKSDQEKIIEAICRLGSDIDLYKDVKETESHTSDIRWSEYEERSAEEILRQ